VAFIKYHVPCFVCGGSDPVSINEDGSGFCFSCRHYYKEYPKETYSKEPLDFKMHQRNKLMNITHEFKFNELTDRKIKLETAKKYGVKSVLSPTGDIERHSYPYYINNEVATFKVRSVEDKQFSWTKPTKGVGLFGEQLFKGGAKYVTLFEGECDAMAGYELMGSQWAALSIRSGASAAVGDIKDSLEYLESFENVIICFDNDKAGREGAINVAKVLSPGKVKIQKLPTGFKDANEMLKQGRNSSFMESWWEAKLYTPAGVLNISDELEDYKKRPKKVSIPYPWEGLNNKIEGLRSGELVLVTGGTGLGKSSVTRELEHWLIKNTEDNVGIVALEEDWYRTVDGIISIEANDKLHIDRIRDQYSEEQIDNFFNILYDGENRNRVWIYSHFGINDIDSIFSKLRYMIVGCECKWLVIDHLHMMVSASMEGDERRTIDSIMTRLRSLCEETGCGMILVSHLRRIDGNKGHENGIETALNHIRGSQSISQLSDCVISLERNQQAEDPVEASTTKIRVLKSRYTGETGVATHLYYNNVTGRLAETDYIEEEIVAEL
jgi:twinkle protein